MESPKTPKAKSSSDASQEGVSQVFTPSARRQRSVPGSGSHHQRVRSIGDWVKSVSERASGGEREEVLTRDRPLDRQGRSDPRRKPTL